MRLTILGRGSYIPKDLCCNGILKDSTLAGFKKSASQLLLDPSFLPVNLPGGRSFLKGSNSEESAYNFPGSFLNASASTVVSVNLPIGFLRVATSNLKFRISEHALCAPLSRSFGCLWGGGHGPFRWGLYRHLPISTLALNSLAQNNKRVYSLS